MKGCRHKRKHRARLGEHHELELCVLLVTPGEKDGYKQLFRSVLLVGNAQCARLLKCWLHGYNTIKVVL